MFSPVSASLCSVSRQAGRYSGPARALIRFQRRVRRRLPVPRVLQQLGDHVRNVRNAISDRNRIRLSYGGSPVCGFLHIRFHWDIVDWLSVKELANPVPSGQAITLTIQFLSLATETGSA